MAINQISINLSGFKSYKVCSLSFGIKLETNYRKISVKSPNIWKLKNTLLNNPWIDETFKREIRMYVGLNENENTLCSTELREQA